MSTPPRTSLVECRIAHGLAVRFRVLESEDHGVRLALAVLDAGHRIDWPPIPAEHLDAFERAITWAAAEARARAAELREASRQSSLPATSAGPAHETTTPALLATTEETDGPQT